MFVVVNINFNSFSLQFLQSSSSKLDLFEHGSNLHKAHVIWFRDLHDAVCIKFILNCFPYKSVLVNIQGHNILVFRYNIQTGFHDPYEDCVSAMRLYKRMRAQDHQIEASEISTAPYKSQNVTSKFDSLRAKELEQMSPDELYEISRPNYRCWCLDSSQAMQPQQFVSLFIYQTFNLLRASKAIIFLFFCFVLHFSEVGEEYSFKIAHSQEKKNWCWRQPRNYAYLEGSY